MGVQVERQEKGEETWRSAKYKATCEPKGGEGKGYKSPEQDHRECCEPKERKWGGEGAQEWEGRKKEAAKCAEGTRRRPMRVRRGTRARGEY